MIRAAHMGIVPLNGGEQVVLHIVGARAETVAVANCSAREWRLIGKAAANAAASVVIGGSATIVELSKRGDAGVGIEAFEGQPPESVQAAHGVRVATESDGSPLIELLDEHGCVFARAEFEPGMFSMFIGDCCDTLEMSGNGGFGSLPCKGEG